MVSICQAYLVGLEIDAKILIPCFCPWLWERKNIHNDSLCTIPPNCQQPPPLCKYDDGKWGSWGRHLDLPDSRDLSVLFSLCHTPPAWLEGWRGRKSFTVWKKRTAVFWAFTIWPALQIYSLKDINFSHWTSLCTFYMERGLWCSHNWRSRMHI